MGEIFRGIKGDMNGFALENADISPNPEDDDTNIDLFFQDETNDLKEFTKKRKKGRRQQKDIFSGF